MLDALPTFPCNADKEPLIAGGFKAARRNANHSGWPLVGFPTGHASGIDILAAGISAEDWVAWCTRDPVYADDGDVIARLWEGAAGRHGGALFAALKEAGIIVGLKCTEVPRGSSGAVSRHHNKRVGDRLIGACVAFKRKPTEPNLFSHACLIAEIVHEHKLVPGRYGTAKPYMDLLAAAAMETELGRTLGRAGVERTIERAFAHVLAKRGQLEAKLMRAERASA